MFISRTKNVLETRWLRFKDANEHYECYQVSDCRFGKQFVYIYDDVNYLRFKNSCTFSI